MNNLITLGVDIGSSSVKAAFLATKGGALSGAAFSPKVELEINAPQAGFAEQDPQVWWDNLKLAVAEAKQQGGVTADQVQAIGISYQMHGLVLVDKEGQVLRPSIIWCDSRAVGIGAKAMQEIGGEYCLEHFLNSPGNFTASKLAWVKENEPEIFAKVHKVMLPGDYIAYRLTGKMQTTIPGLSEGIMWDFKEQAIAEKVLSHFGISAGLIPEITDTFLTQGALSKEAAVELGLNPGTVISYRAGDQPNNALSLNVLNPGEVAATAGTSGVIYGVSAQNKYDELSRVNTFAHVNYSKADPRYGVLLCINGTGCLNSWVRRLIDTNISYARMNEYAANSPIGSEGLIFLPYGNGAERSLGNRDIGSSIHGLNFSRHTVGDICRAAQEGIVFAMKYGLDVMQEVGVDPGVVRAGKANMFLSPVFCEAFVNTTGATLQLYKTDGAEGAARGAALGAGIYANPQAAFAGLKQVEEIKPDPEKIELYQKAYQRWLAVLKTQLG